jgi:hypothetical protein
MKAIGLVLPEEKKTKYSQIIVSVDYDNNRVFVVDKSDNRRFSYGGGWLSQFITELEIGMPSAYVSYRDRQLEAEYQATKDFRAIAKEAEGKAQVVLYEWREGL